MNQETDTPDRSWRSRRVTVERLSFAVAFLFVLIFLAAWPWEIFQRVFGGLTLALGASLLVLAFGLIRMVAISPRSICLLKSLGLPIALIAFACIQSALHSADPTASRALVIKYVWYLALLGVAAPLFMRTGDAVLAWRVFSVSAGLVGVYAVLCAAGWFTPALAGTHEYFGRRLTEDVRVGAFVRIAATTPDYNQAILPMLAALPFLLLWAASPASRRAGRPLAAVLALFVIAGVIVSFSRSGLLAVGAVLFGGSLLLVRGWAMGKKPPPQPSPCQREGEETSPDRLSAITPLKGGLGTAPTDGLPQSPFEGGPERGRRWLVYGIVGLVLIALSVALLMVAGGYSEMLVRRALRGFNSPDPSYRSRFYVFGLAFKLLPKYALFGCGIGASGAAIGAVAEPGKWMGTALHSMPLMMWFETGILGLVGFFWLWWRLVRQVWTGVVQSPEMERRRLGIATLGALGVLFWMTSIQPFQELSLFPVFAALSIGATRGVKNAEAPASPIAARGWCVAFACAMVLVAGLVTSNILTYQNTVGKPVSWYANALEEGLAAEQRGDWETARTAYWRAERIAFQPPFLLSLFGHKIQYLPYYEEAFRATDLEFIFLRLPGRGGRADLPCDVAGFGVARCLWNLGKAEPALKKCQDNMLRMCWPEFVFAVGEMYWKEGQYEAALHEWTKAASLNETRNPFPPLEYPFDVAPSMDEIYKKLDAEAKPLAGSTKPSDIARRIALLLRMNRQEEAIKALKTIPAEAPELATFRAALKVH